MNGHKSRRSSTDYSSDNGSSSTNYTNYPATPPTPHSITMGDEFGMVNPKYYVDEAGMLTRDNFVPLSFFVSRLSSLALLVPARTNRKPT